MCLVPFTSIQSTQISASHFTRVAAKVVFIAFRQKQCNALCLSGKVFDTQDGETNQTLGLSWEKCNLLLKPESHCSSPAVNDVGEQVARG